MTICGRSKAQFILHTHVIQAAGQISFWPKTFRRFQFTEMASEVSNIAIWPTTHGHGIPTWIKCCHM